MKQLILTISIILVTTLPSTAQVPQTVSYQGVLTDGLGTPVADSNYDLTFRIYTVSSGGAEIWSETQSVLVFGGIFSVVLGSNNALDIAFDQPYWLGISVDGGAEFTLTPMPTTIPGRALVSRSTSTPAIFATQ